MSACLTSDQFGAGVLVDFGHVYDRAGLLRVAQSAQAFFHVAARWTKRGDHGRLRVAAEALFQQPAEGEPHIRSAPLVGVLENVKKKEKARPSFQSYVHYAHLQAIDLGIFNKCILFSTPVH